MENLEKRNQHGTLLTLSEKVKDLVRIIVDVNLIIAYKLDVEDLKRWAVDLDRLVPELSLDQLRFIFDCFKLETIEFDKTVGIQNIHRALKLTYMEAGEWRVRKQGVY